MYKSIFYIFDNINYAICSKQDVTKLSNKAFSIKHVTQHNLILLKK